MKQTRKLRTQNLTGIALMTAILCITGPFAIPIGLSPVPVTLSTLTIYLCLFAIGLKKGCVSILLYLLLGFMGLPVFAGFSGGIGKLFGPTGGYLMGYLLLAFIAGLFINKRTNKWYLYLLGMFLGTAACYLFGSVWMAYQMQLSYLTALSIGTLPYLPADLIKMLLALLLGYPLRRAMTSASLVLY